MSKDLLEHACSIGGMIYLTSFWGGKNKRCIQLTLDSGSYVQMTNREAKKFFKDALKAVYRIDIKYTKNRPWWESLSEAMEEAKVKPSVPYNPKEKS